MWLLNEWSYVCNMNDLFEDRMAIVCDIYISVMVVACYLFLISHCTDTKNALIWLAYPASFNSIPTFPLVIH